MSDIRYNSWLHRSGTGGVYQDSSGRVGIGTSAIGALLAVPAQASGDSGVPRIAIESKVDANDFTISQYEDGTGTYTLLGQNVKLSSGGNDTVLDSSHKTASIMMDGRGNGALMFNTGGANETEERMRIDSSGHVGVTSTSPVATRFSGTVSGLINLAGTKPCVYISETDSKDSSGTNRALYMGLASGTAYVGSNAPFSFATGDTTTTERVRIDTAGNVNITGVTTAAAFVPSGAEQQLSHRNVWMNGAAQIAQRGSSQTSISSSSGTPTGGPDRTSYLMVSNHGTWTFSQDSDGPPGFAKCYNLTATTGDGSVASNAAVRWWQKFEGQDLQRFMKGTSSAKQFTLSFWVKSTTTGAYAVELLDYDNSNRGVTRTYTISQAATWEYKTITFPADTTGAFDNDNAASFAVEFWLVAGTDNTSGGADASWHAYSDPKRAGGHTANAGGSNNDYHRITGIQLEAGDVATPFEHRTYGEDLALCQRYYQTVPDSVLSSGYGSANGYSRGSHIFATTMRTTPTVTITETSSGGLLAQGQSKDGFYATFDGLTGSGASLFNFIATAEL